MDAMECLRTRRSVRGFSDKAIPKNVIEDMVDAGRLAPTANNVQPWEFIIITDKAVRQKIAGITNYGKFIAESPVCIVVVCRETKYYLEDGCAATENIMLAAQVRGIGTCWVAGDKKPYADEILRVAGVPSGYKLVSLIAAGYPADASPAKDLVDKSGSARGKRGLKEVLHMEKF